jgi:hypothetical protein
MLATIDHVGLVLLGGWITMLLGVSLLRDAGPGAQRLRGAGVGVLAVGLALAVVARVGS